MSWLRLSTATVTMFVASAVSAQNVIPGNWSTLSSSGVYQTLRPGSPWGPGSGGASQARVVNGAFLPTGTQWNAAGTWWWDQDLSVNPDQASYTRPMGIDIFLNNTYTVNRFVVQADDNDSYRLDYWDGSAWQLAWEIAPVFTFGMETRDSGILPFSISTSRLRFYATGGDNYYSVSEIQAFATVVPEPATESLMALGLLGLVVVAARRRRSRALMG